MFGALMHSTLGQAKRWTTAEACLLAVEIETGMTEQGWPLSDLEKGDLVIIQAHDLTPCPRCGCWHPGGDGFGYCDQEGQA